jgi:hypothetical protein
VKLTPSNEKLTKEKYDTVMSIDSSFMQESSVFYTGDQPDMKKESLTNRRGLKALLEKKELSKKTSVLKWNDFSNTFQALYGESGYYINEGQSQKRVDFICRYLKSGGDSKEETTPTPIPQDLNTDNILEGWEGLKPFPDGAYMIPYDESFLEAGIDAGKYALAGAAIAGLVVLTGGAALGAMGLSAGAAGTAAGAAGMAEATLAGAAMAGMGTVTKIGLVSAFALGGASGLTAKYYGEDRVTVTILIRQGYITKQALVAVTRGLIDTLDGAVYSADMRAIQLTLCLLQGAWTFNQGKAVSAFAYVQKYYENMENGEIIFNEIKNIGTLTVKKITDFPDFETPGETSTLDPDDAKGFMLDAHTAMTQNGPSLKQNLDKLNKLGPDKLKELIQKITEATPAVETSSETSTEGEAETE